jgi:aspartate/methionine/tyrosine aminotransferase
MVPVGAFADSGGFVSPVYPFDKLGDFAELAGRLPGGAVDLSVGTPCDPPHDKVVAALAQSCAERGYPASVGSSELREAAASWLERRFAVSVSSRDELAVCVGTKELVAGIPQWLHLRTPARDSVLYPALSYPTYEMGALLAGCRPVAVPARSDGRMDLQAIDPADAGRALCLWVNSPGNPAGQLEDLGEVAQWGRQHNVPVLSDECYAEFTFEGPPRSILEEGPEGVLAVHSLSKRSNLAGLRVGFYAGDAELVGYLSSIRRHAGFIVPGPVQHAAAVAYDDDESVIAQKETYRERLCFLAEALTAAGIEAKPPPGAFYLWVKAPDRFAAGPTNPGFELGRYLAERGGAIVSPGEAYGPGGVGFVRLAVVQPMERLALVADRLSA